MRGVDLKEPEYTSIDADSFEIRDLRIEGEAQAATRDVDHVYALAADMGGMGFISANHATILHNNALINLHTIEAARRNGVKRYLYSSSACVYPEYLQTDADVRPLREEDAYPAQPQDAYGWEKLMTEILCRYYADEYRDGDSHRPLPQRLRAVRHLRRGSREGASGPLPEGRIGTARGCHRRLG